MTRPIAASEKRVTAPHPDEYQGTDRFQEYSVELSMGSALYSTLSPAATSSRIQILYLPHSTTTPHPTKQSPAQARADAPRVSYARKAGSRSLSPRDGLNDHLQRPSRDVPTLTKKISNPHRRSHGQHAPPLSCSTRSCPLPTHTLRNLHPRTPANDTESALPRAGCFGWWGGTYRYRMGSTCTALVASHASSR